MANVMLVAEIMQRAGASGDPKLVGLIGELMKELNAEGGAGTADGGVEVQDSGIAPSGMKYVVCVEATTKDGVKMQHPLIGGGYAMPRDIDDIKMTMGSNRGELESQMGYIADTLRRNFGVKVTYVLVSDEAIALLEQRLRELLQNLSDAIDEAAQAKEAACRLMNVEVSADDISDDMLMEIIRKTMYAGSAVGADGKVVERADGETYVEEDNIAERKSADSDDDDDDDDYEDEDEEDDDYDDDDDGDYDDEDAEDD